MKRRMLNGGSAIRWIVRALLIITMLLVASMPLADREHSNCYAYDDHGNCILWVPNPKS